MLVVAARGLSHLKLVPYCARRPGVSVSGLVRSRGRWRTEQSVRRYEGQVMVQKVAASMRAAQQQAELRDQIQLPSGLTNALA